jgi:cephalosporin hydroxylase
VRRIDYKCGCETHFEEKEGVYEISPHGQVCCPYHSTDAFHIAFYQRGVWKRNTTWFGYSILKNPMDIMVLQEIISETKPDLIIETGTFKGGGALFFAHMLDLNGHGSVYTIENNIKDNGYPIHNRILYLKGDSASQEAINTIKANLNGAKSIMVCLDSAHDKDHVLKEMELYAPLVTVGNYLVVDDTNINNPMYPTCDGKRIYEQGPHEAVMEFIKTHKEFKIDRYREKYLFTFNPDGYLLRVKEDLCLKSAS